MKRDDEMFRYRILNGARGRGEPIEEPWREPEPAPRPSTLNLGTRGLLIVGAATLAGVGLGLVAAVAGAAVIGLAGEAIMAPALALKVAGGLAGGGVGMAKGLKEARDPDGISRERGGA